MFQKLTIARAQTKSGNTSGNLPNEICQIIFSWYYAKNVIKKYITI